MNAAARILVTGGAGFIGSHLCAALLRRGAEVVCVDSMVTGSEENVAALHGDAFELMRGDVTAGVDVAGRVDWVLHFASIPSPVDYQRLPLETLLVGTHGTYDMLRFAERKGARFLLASTSEVYGDPLVHPQVETYWGNVNPIGARSMYDESKRVAESYVMAFHRSRGLDTRIVRIFNTYGPRMRSHDGRAVPQFMEQALRNEPITVYGDGSQTRSLCYVDDLVDGVLRAMDCSRSLPINLGNPHEVTMLEVAQLVREVCGSSSEIVTAPLPEDDPRRRQPDITVARRELGWEPRVALDEGLRNTAAWWRERLATAAVR